MRGAVIRAILFVVVDDGIAPLANATLKHPLKMRPLRLTRITLHKKSVQYLFGSYALFLASAVIFCIPLSEGSQTITKWC